jgi:chaperonin GroES
MKIKPLEDRVLVKPLEGKDEVKGGIIIPDTAKEKPEKGEIIAVGPGKMMETGQIKKVDVKKGDKVLFTKYAGNEITVSGDKHLIMREDEILAVIEE